MSAPDVGRRSLLDDELQAVFATQGYAVLDLIERQSLDRFAERFDRLYTGDRVGFHSSMDSADYDYRDRLGRELVETFGHLVDRFFDDHSIAMTQATVKWAGADSSLGAHQDWTMVDERRFRSLNVWIPLIDTDEDNGALFVVPGSHRRLRRLRPNGGFPSWYRDEALDVDPSSFVPVHVRVGQAIVTDHAILHRSPSNNSGRPRVAVVIALVPNEAEVFHSFRSADDSIVRYTIDDPSFFRRVIAFQDPSHLADGLGREIVEFDVQRTTERSDRSLAGRDTELPEPGGKPRWGHLLRRAIAPARHR